MAYLCLFARMCHNACPMYNYRALDLDGRVGLKIIFSEYSPALYMKGRKWQKKKIKQIKTESFA